MLKHISIIFIIISFALAFYLYPQLPDQIASHWNINGEVDGYMDKTTGVFLFPVITLGMYLIFLLLPKIDPLRENYKKFQKYYDMLILVMVIFLTYMHGVTLAINLGYDLAMNTMILPPLALLFFFISVLMKHAKQNWFVGIRTPWTLSSEHVWDKTHTLASKLFILFGILFLVAIALPDYYSILIGSVVVGSLGLVVYSYWEFRKERA